MKNILIIGTGGITGYLLPAFNRTYKNDRVTLQDGDTLEERNIDRQLFDAKYIGRFKAAALNLTCKSKHTVINRYYDGESLSGYDFVLILVDNDRCRRAALQAVDNAYALNGKTIHLIFAANETNDAIAYVYTPSMKGTHADPRVRYPEINTNDEGHPFHCTSEAQLAIAPQTATANARAAAHALWLLNLWYNAESFDRICYEIYQSKYKTETRHREHA